MHAEKLACADRSLPDTTAVSDCYLEMVDDFGDKMASPTFSFGSESLRGLCDGPVPT